jgi:AcrR family transcriptional regulator
MTLRRTPEETRELRSSLIEHAQRIVKRDGLQALTMRALATASGCSVGLPYKVFASRDELIAEMVELELEWLRDALDAWSATAGTRTVADNLIEYARVMFESERPVVTHGLGGRALAPVIADLTKKSGLEHSFESTVTDYLRAEQELGRIAAHVDARAYGFLITGAIHNLITAGDAYPRPDPKELRRILRMLARDLAGDEALDDRDGNKASST